MFEQLVSDSQLIHPSFWRKSACNFLDDCLARTLHLKYHAGLIVSHIGRLGQAPRLGRRGSGFGVGRSLEARRIPSAAAEVRRTPSAAAAGLPHKVRAGRHMVPVGLLTPDLCRYSLQRHMMEGVHSLAADCKQELKIRR